MAGSMVTLIIPTMNRSNFLVRLLRYYYDLNFQGCILIGDSSEAMHLEHTKKAIHLFQDRLNIIHKEYEVLKGVEWFWRSLDFVSTPYVAYIGDDDFLVPKALDQCAQFLDRHPDYSAAHGLGVLFTLSQSGAHGPVKWLGPYRLPVAEAETGAQRLLDHLSSYSVPVFSVFRLELWQLMWQSTHLDMTFGGELVPGCLATIKGKFKEFDCLYLLRQAHERRFLLPNLLDWLTDSNWLPSYQVFRDLMAEKLSKQDHVDLDEAHSIVKQAFQVYLVQAIDRKFQHEKNTQGRFLRFRQATRSIPSSRCIWRLLQSLRHGELRRQIRWEKLSLPALKRPSSKYHDDFMPFYRLVTAGVNLSSPV